MKTHFSSVILPPSPNQCCKRLVDVYLFPTLKKGEGGRIHTKGKKVGHCRVSQRLLSMIVGRKQIDLQVENKLT